MGFFKDECLSLVKTKEFGICDQQDGRAYVDTADVKSWIAKVENPSGSEVQFYAVDNCIIYQNAEGGRISSCDAAIKVTTNKLLFVELKERKYSGWISTGIAQLESTLQLYKQYETNQAGEIICYLSNSLRPKVPKSRVRAIADLREKFKQSTGADLRIEVTINI